MVQHNGVNAGLFKCEVNGLAICYLKYTESRPVTAIIMIRMFDQDLIVSDFSYLSKVIYC